MRVLVVGDRFILAGYCVDAPADVCGARFGPGRSVDRSGSEAQQHAARQTMEWCGAGAAAVLGEIVGTVGEAEAPAVPDQEPLPADSPWRGPADVPFTTHQAGDTTARTLRRSGQCPRPGAGVNVGA
ncbi:hypothetical protein [Streptomyces fulvoviolaceus]|uniref:hypothetical protein n=1 Tax=Streptomyces fulvoviolaceus TaxID=285535 RepID=UPI0004C5CD9D|nr:hypothetical protein [Streptomyces fulvoviolaceus]MCT9078685.1 hypothetical protein [Streptomyces fulvoviolaceus]